MTRLHFVREHSNVTNELLLDEASRTFLGAAASCDEPVLLMGETGSGKTTLAKAIHRLSERSGHRFVSVSCGAIPETIFEREMFGHVRGAFTDAASSEDGLFKAADKGTLFLDELAELSPAAQAKLLDAVESKQVRRLGATTPVQVNIRLVAATNRDLLKLLRRGAFREDLYHRLAVLIFRVPPVRAHRAQIPTLVECLLRRIKHPTRFVTVSPDAMRVLCAYAWPGNVRELENALRHALAFSSDGVIDIHNLPDQIRSAAYRGCDQRIQAHLPDEPSEERRVIVASLLACNGNRTMAARQLNISRSTLWVKMRMHRIQETEIRNGEGPSL